ncbi:MAG: hypothetical protein LBQ75_07495 [Zoogloeaceae bacterium]|nr:hypothetical protein [Zoogloeaceae bacterium]
MLPKISLCIQRLIPASIIASCKARQRQREKGVAHAALIFFAVIVAAVTVGGLAWMAHKMSQNSRGSQGNQSSQDSASRTAPRGSTSLPNSSPELRIEPDLLVGEFSGNCEDIEFAGVKLGMSYRQARAGLVRHFNLSPDEALEKIKPDTGFLRFHPSIRDKKNPTKAEWDRAAQEAPLTGFDYNCEGTGTGTLSDPVRCTTSQYLRAQTLVPNPIAQPSAVFAFLPYVDRALTRGEVIAKLGSPDRLDKEDDTCHDADGKETCLRWGEAPPFGKNSKRRTCKWQGKEVGQGKVVTWSATFWFEDKEVGVEWPTLLLTVHGPDGVRGPKDPNDIGTSADVWLKAKGWWTEADEKNVGELEIEGIDPAELKNLQAEIEKLCRSTGGKAPGCKEMEALKKGK